MKILVVEDEKNISDIIEKYLKKNGFECKLASNGFEALELFSKEDFHLILLDVMMPGIDGFEVLENIRHFSDVPIIMLTAKQEEVDRLKGFEKGADDYVLKPFSPRELISRIKVFMKRIYHDTNELVLKEGDLKLFPNSMRLEKCGVIIDLTGTEFKLLHTFMRHRGQVLSREQLIELSFGVGYSGFDRNIDSYIKRLRVKIENNPKSPGYLVTKYGVGYIFGGGIDDNS